LDFLFKNFNMLDEGHFKVQSRIGHRIANRRAELGDDDLFALLKNKKTIVHDNNGEKNETCK